MPTLRVWMPPLAPRRDRGAVLVRPIRHVVARLACALMFGPGAVRAAGTSPPVLPDFASLISREAAVVVRLTTTSTGGATAS